MKKKKLILIIKHLRYTKLNNLYTYYYICLNDSFMDLTEDTQDLENVDTFIIERSYHEALSIEQLSEYFKGNNIDVDKNKNSDNIILISIQNDPDKIINNFKEYLKYKGYESFKKRRSNDN